MPEIKWYVKFSKDGLAFVWPFVDMTEMLRASSIATRAGYKVETLPNRKASK